jgi:hypothetical protein
MSAPVFSEGDQGSELERAEPNQRADSSSVLRSEVRETHADTGGVSAALPCQRNGNCIEEDDDENESASNQLSPYRRKCRHRLIMAIEWMVKKTRD